VVTSATDVTTSNGVLAGFERSGVRAWRGIPYAAPPVGELRYQPPQPAPRWTGVRDATRYGARAMQIVRPLPGLAGSPAGPGSEPSLSEDCLYLNVCAPADARDRGGLPVLVWIHGGGYVGGFGAEFVGDGVAFARKHGIIFVTFNYRLGALGFLNLAPVLGERYAPSANLGVLDQLAAAGWVRENISAFGGDPARVTLGGVSAGAKSVCTLISAPQARGLFTRAISESGGGDHVATPEASAGLAAAVFGELGIPADRGREILAVPAQEIVAAADRLTVPGRNMWVWRPTVDGSLIPVVPAAGIAAGAARGIPLLAGSNAREAVTFTELDPAAADPAPGVLAAAFGADRAGEIIADYRRRRPGAPPRAVNAAIMTDERYGIPTVRVTDAQSAFAPVFRYYFNATVPWVPRSTAGGHGTELVLAFGLAPESGSGVGQLGRTMRQFWASFVQDGVPTAEDGPSWPAYDADRRRTMVFEVPPHVALDPAGPDRACWRDDTWPSSTWHPLASRPLDRKHI
jgi:para-nitrobenzyl esterase